MEVITPASKMKDPVQRLAYWINEREKIRLKKEANTPPPWTKDPILGAYRFCCVNRENDKVTQWIAENWRVPNAYDENLWHAMIVARYINWPDTLEGIGYPEPWKTKRLSVNFVMHKRKEAGNKVFTGAYIVSTNGATMNKIDFVCKLFDIAWKAQPIRPGMKLAEAYSRLMDINGIGSFMAAQIIADLKNTPYLESAPDWNDWAAPGPGSLRGLSRVRGYGTGSRWNTKMFVGELAKLRAQLQPLIKDLFPEGFCLQDLQNCLCEFDKMERVRLGQGKPRAGYTPQ